MRRFLSCVARRSLLAILATQPLVCFMTGDAASASTSECTLYAADPKSEQVVADIGCTNGGDAAGIARALGPGTIVIGPDLSNSDIDFSICRTTPAV